jgi:hypothetical protein
LQSFAKRGHSSLTFWVFRDTVHKHRNSPLSSNLLRVRDKRPRGR